MNTPFLSLFPHPKPIIGMVHLGDLNGSLLSVIQSARDDIHALIDGGIDGILLENWKETSSGPFVSKKIAKHMEHVVKKLVPYITVPFGINVLNNDYKAAFAIAKKTHASFVQLDVFTDHVISDYSYNHTVKRHPFEIQLKPETVWAYAQSISMNHLPCIVFIHPKHYKMVDKGKTIGKSVVDAITGGASGLIVTQETGVAPSKKKLIQAKKAAGITPVGIGSGINKNNVYDFMKIGDFAIVGSSIKHGGNVDNAVSTHAVKALMIQARKAQMENF